VSSERFICWSLAGARVVVPLMLVVSVAAMTVFVFLLCSSFAILGPPGVTTIGGLPYARARAHALTDPSRGETRMFTCFLPRLCIVSWSSIGTPKARLSGRECKVGARCLRRSMAET
jgi:hypothetical protein